MSDKQHGILFDLDGVIIDSEGLYTGFWEKTEKEFPTGIPDFARAIKGTNLEKILEHFPSEQTRTTILERIYEFDRNLNYPLFPGAMELLEGLRQANVPTALYTSSNPEKMERLFAIHPQLRDMFDAIINGAMVTRSKPDPEGYIMAAEAIGCRPQDCVVVEDSLQGIRAGKAAGATVAAIAGTVPRAILEQEGVRVFGHISQLTPQTLINLQ